MSDLPFDQDYDTTEYFDSNGILVQFVDIDNKRIHPLKNDPTKYPYAPVVPKQPTRFPKDDITQIILDALHASYIPNSEKELKINNEVNAIKYRVLKANNLGQNSYEHLYFVEHDTNTASFPDYFTDILDKLIDIFPEATITYTLLKDGYNATAVNSNKNIHKTDYDNKKSGNISEKVNEKYSISNIIRISWS